MSDKDKVEEPVKVVTGKEAKKLLTLSRRVTARRSSAVGLLASVADLLRGVHSLYIRAAPDTTLITQQEIALLLSFTKRLERRTRELALARVTGMAEIVPLLNAAVRQLDEADKGGYGIKNLQRQAEVDRRTLQRLQTSIKARVQEGAAVLAELEQAVDPVPGMRLVSGRQRALNAKMRKKQLATPPLPPGVRPEDVIVAPPLIQPTPGLLRDKTVKNTVPTSEFSR